MNSLKYKNDKNLKFKKLGLILCERSAQRAAGNLSMMCERVSTFN